MCFKALLLHGSLPEDEQDVSLALDQGEADQQVVKLHSPLLPPLISAPVSQRHPALGTARVSSSLLDFVRECVYVLREADAGIGFSHTPLHSAVTPLLFSHTPPSR